jgi:hypothetical protein
MKYMEIGVRSASADVDVFLLRRGSLPEILGVATYVLVSVVALKRPSTSYAALALVSVSYSMYNLGRYAVELYAVLKNVMPLLETSSPVFLIWNPWLVADPLFQSVTNVVTSTSYKALFVTPVKALVTAVPAYALNMVPASQLALDELP